MVEWIVRQFSRNGLGLGYLVAVTGSTWALHGSSPSALYHENRLAVTRGTYAYGAGGGGGSLLLFFFK